MDKDINTYARTVRGLIDRALVLADKDLSTWAGLRDCCRSVQRALYHLSLDRDMTAYYHFFATLSESFGFMTAYCYAQRMDTQLNDIYQSLNIHYLDFYLVNENNLPAFIEAIQAVGLDAEPAF